MRTFLPRTEGELIDDFLAAKLADKAVGGGVGGISRSWNIKPTNQVRVEQNRGGHGRIPVQRENIAEIVSNYVDVGQ